MQVIRIARPGGQRDRRGRGQSLAEFAVVAPIMLLIALGVVDLTRVFADWVALTSGVREAALWASEPPNYSDSATVRNIVLQEGSLDGSRLSVSAPSCGGGCTPTSSTVTVSATYSVTLVVPFLDVLLGDPVPLSASATAPIIDHSAPAP